MFSNMRLHALIGAGGFAREIKAHMGILDMPCFVEDKYYKSNKDNVFPVSIFDPSIYEVLIAIGDSVARKEIVNRLPKNTKYFSFIHPSAQILGDDVIIGDGSIVCAGSIITTNVVLGEHSQINLNTTIGHDSTIGNYFTTAPGVHISGHCTIGNCVYFGTNSSTKQEISICDCVTIGMNAGVTKNIHIPGTYIGTPAKYFK